MTHLNIQQTLNMIIAVCDRVIESEPLLTEVDRQIGDGDHGIGMSEGMKKAKTALLEKASFETVNEVFKLTGMTMLNSMGGASGVIFGSLFLGGVKNLEPSSTLDASGFRLLLRGALDAVKKRGKAEVGDKTMVDALEPAVLAMEASDTDNLVALLEVASEAAQEGVENSKKYVAKFGKAQYLGERAVGHQDAGATSVSIIFKAMHDYLLSVA